MDILVVLIALLCVLMTYMKYLKSKRLPPGPWGLPLLGYLPWINKKKPYETLTELAGKYGPIYSMTMGSVLTVVLSDPQLIREALSKDVFTARADLYLTHGMMDGYGLIASEGDKWKEQRRFVASFLKGLGVVKVGSKRAVMEERILVGLRESIKMIDDLNGKATDPNDILLHSLGNVINLIVFGKIWSYDDEEWIWLRARLKEGVKLIGVAGPINFLPFLRWWPGYAPTLRYLVEGKRKTHLLYEKIAQDKEDGQDLISYYKTAILKNTGKYFDRKQMYHVLADMFGAGSDTSLTTIRWFLLFIAANPKIQEKLHKEIDNVLGQRKEICLNDMEFMPYTMASLYETQRIRSIVPLGIPHGTWEKTSLSGYEIPPQAMILILQWAVHMNPNEFPNPEEFLPERFLNEEGKLIKKHDFFLPFQCGKRVCIGEEIAKMMMFIFGAGLLSEFSISVLEEGQELEKALDGVCGLTFGPGDHKLIFKKRNNL